VPNQPSTERLCCSNRLIVALLCLCTLPAAAADGLLPGQEALRLQQQQQRDLQQLQLEQRQRQIQRGSFAVPPTTPALPADTAQDQRCWPLSGTRVAGED
jgi:hemolysin activation/secretion protein